MYGNYFQFWKNVLIQQFFLFFTFSLFLFSFLDSTSLVDRALHPSWPTLLLLILAVILKLGLPFQLLPRTVTEKKTMVRNCCRSGVLLYFLPLLSLATFSHQFFFFLLFYFMITYEDNKAPLRLNVTVRFLVVVFIRILLILPWEEAEKICFKIQCALIECSHLSIASRSGTEHYLLWNINVCLLWLDLSYLKVLLNQKLVWASFS